MASLRVDILNMVHSILKNEVSAGMPKKKHIVLLSLTDENNFMFNISQDEKRNKFRLRKKQFAEDDFIDTLICPCQISNQSTNILYALSTRNWLLKPKGFILRLQPSNQTPRLIWMNEKSMLEIFQPIILNFSSR